MCYFSVIYIYPEKERSRKRGKKVIKREIGWERDKKIER